MVAFANLIESKFQFIERFNCSNNLSISRFDPMDSMDLDQDKIIEAVNH